MTKEEYEAKRQQLFDKFNELIDAEKVDEANAVLKDVDALDDKWDAITEAQANFNARYRADNRRIPAAVMDWSTGDRYYLDGSIHGYRRTGEVSPFLNSAQSMTDKCLGDHPDQRQIIETPNALADTVRGIVTGRWDNQALRNAITTTTTGTLIPEVLSSQVIDLARNVSLFTQAGVPIVAMDTDNMTVSRLKTDPVFSFKAEGAEANESSFEMDAVKLKAKTIYGYAYVSLEAIKSSRNLDAVIRQAFAAALADCIDKAFLYGQQDSTGAADSAAPSGIMNDTSILSVTNEYQKDTTQSTASWTLYDDFIQAVTAIRAKNGTPSTWALSPVLDGAMNLLKDDNGSYLEIPAPLNSMNKIVTNQLEENQGLVFDPAAMIVGIQEALSIKIIEDTECLKKGLVAFQIYSMQDCQVLRPWSICKVTRTNSTTESTGE